MAGMTKEDEALIEKFIGLSTEDANATAIIVPQHAASSTNWDKCLLVRVLADRPVQEGPFIQTMIGVWNVDPSTTARQIARNCYLVEFEEVEDRVRVQNGGPWLFRGDLVASSQVKSQKDLNLMQVSHAAVWVQFHNLPVNSLTEEGLMIMAQEVGTPVSSPVHCSFNGRSFVKVKILLPLQAVIKDKVKLTHPLLGELIVLCVYERIGKVCVFCGSLGHEMVKCPDHTRVSAIVHDPANAGRYNAAEILKPKKGQWVTSLYMLPKPQEGQSCQGNKRSRGHTQTGQHELLLPHDRVGGQDTGVTLEMVMGDGSNSQSFSKRLKPAGQNAPAHFL